MSQPMPQSIADYFAGKNARDYALALSGFAPDGTVSDEERQHVGAEAIQRWMEETAAKYNDRSQVREASADGDRTVVTAEVSGTFPGSPIELRYAFTLRDGLITSLAIDS
ncbi:MAG: nuclear transport factor 2 family protein [Thermomicrobiales bacterium]